MVDDSTVDIVVAVDASHYKEAVTAIGIAHTAAAAAAAVVVVVADMVAWIVVMASKKRSTAAASSLVSNTSCAWLVYIVVAAVEASHLPSSWMPLVVADILAAVGKRRCTADWELVATSSLHQNIALDAVMRVLTLDCSGPSDLRTTLSRSSFLDCDCHFVAVPAHAITFSIDCVTWIHVVRYPSDFEYRKRSVYIDIYMTATVVIRHRQ